MDENSKLEVKECLFDLLSKSVAMDYVNDIYDKIKDEVIQDVEETADPDEWNDSDVRIALGRVLSKYLGLEN